MNLVELELDETLADFEVQDWIDNVFSVQYPYVKARIKKVCSGLCHKKDKWHYVKDGDLPRHENYVLVSNGKDWTKAFYKDRKWNVISSVGFLHIIAWKEIVLPKERE